MSKNIIITGVNGQLGQFIVKYLLENQADINIIGTIRHKSYDDQKYIFDKSKITFELMDLTDVHSIENLIIKYKPDYFVNCAANAFVGDSWKVPIQHMEQNCIGVLHQLEAIRKHSPYTRYFNMGTSEEFGNTNIGGFQDETTPLDPKSPYGASKAAARHLISVYRKSYNLYAIQNWTFNFESEMRGYQYVTKKITMGVARIKDAIDNNVEIIPIELGNLNSSRSWQFCGDVADSIWKSLNQEKFRIDLRGIGEFDGIDTMYYDLSRNIKEYVVSSPECHTIRELVEESFKCVGIDNLVWDGDGVDEVLWYKDISGNPHKLIKINPIYFRPVDVTFLNGNSALIQKELGWKPTLTFKQLVKRMVDYDVSQLK